jgi:hypothetical protein
MRPTTTRRLLVFAVCAFGVGALYWVPTLAGTPEQLSTGPAPESQPGSGPSRTPMTSATGTAAPTSAGDAPTTVDTAGRTVDATQGPSSDRSRTGTSTTGLEPTDRASGEPRRGATARDPDDPTDRTKPEPVPAVRVAAATADTLTVRWAPASDDVGVVSYRVWLNGFEVASTDGLKATVDWFNDDSEVTTVQVRAIDAAGNQSPPSATVLASRPEPEPAPTPSPSPTPTPNPSPTSPTPTPTPSPSSTSPAPTATPTPGQESVSDPLAVAPSPSETP